MAEQDRWTHDRGRDRHAQEDRFRRGFDEPGRRGDYSAGDRDRPGQGRGHREAYGDYDRSFEHDRGATRAYGAAYGIDEDRYQEGRYDEGGRSDPRYGGRWGGGPAEEPGAQYYSGRYDHSDPHAREQGYSGEQQRRQAYGGGHDRTWMERTGERVAAWFGGGEVERSHGGGHRGRGPKNYTRSDDRIREDINDRLTDDAWLDASEIEVQVAQCEVTLSGTVTRREDRRRAEDLAERVSGVRHVQNDIRVEPTGGQDQAQGAWRP